MAKVTAAEYTEKWNRRMKGSTEDIRRGVGKVTEAPGMAAAKQQALMLEKLTASIMSGKWAKAVSAISVEDWKQSTLNKGLQRIAAGVDGATPAMQQKAQELLAKVDSAVNEVNKIPRGNLEQNIQRMVAFTRAMAK